MSETASVNSTTPDNSPAVRFFLATSAKYLGVPEIQGSPAAGYSELISADEYQYPDASCLFSSVQAIHQEGRL